MSDSRQLQLDERLLVAAATARDAELTRALLAEAGMACAVCASLEEVCREISRGAGALLLSEEALEGGSFARLAEALLAQPVWSDVPVLLLTGRGADSAIAARAMDTLPSVTVLERPVRIVTLVSTLRTALRSRRRQYALRDQMEALRASEALNRTLLQRLTKLVDNTPLAVVEWDANFIVTRWSGEAEKVFGWSPAEVVGRRIDELPLVYEEDVPRVEAVIARLRDPANAFVVSHNRNRRKSGEVISCDWYNSILHDEAGGMVAVLSLVLDVSRRERALEALREADRRKDEFLAVLGHELRNPLTPIRTGLELLRRVGGNEKLAEEVRQGMERQVRHMVRLIDDLVDVARITRGALTLRRERVEVAEIMKSALEAARATIESARHQVAVSLPGGALAVDGDPVRLTQVLVNLLTNAARYTPAGGRIAVGAAHEDSQAVITVADNGIGIPPAMLERVFELFTQVESGAGRSYGGLGIGLALARSLVQLHGGSIQARSAGPGAGSTFTVRLPLAASGVPATRTPAAQPATARRLRILVVDDNSDVAAATGMLLEQMGHEARLAHEAADVLDAAASAPPPDVALLDLGMPGMDGYALARALRERPAYAAVPFVAVSGFGRDIDRRRSEEAGFTAHLVKPFEPETLERLLASLTAG